MKTPLGLQDAGLGPGVITGRAIMETIDLVKKDWRKSTYSNPSGNCVEVAENVPGRVYIRDSKHPEIGHLDIPANEWYGIVRWLGNFCPEPVSAN